jgi:hypothetical protein
MDERLEAALTEALAGLAMLPAEMLYELVAAIRAWYNGEGPLSELMYAWGQIASGEVAIE